MLRRKNDWRYDHRLLNPAITTTTVSVDTADYLVWRKNQGTTNVLKNDGIGGTIDAPQYSEWRAQYANSRTAGLVGSFYVGYRENIIDDGTGILCLARGRRRST